jgi:hypothetical protein
VWNTWAVLSSTPGLVSSVSPSVMQSRRWKSVIDVDRKRSPCTRSAIPK